MDLRESLLNANDLRSKEVFVKQWDQTVTVQELGLQESLEVYGTIKPDEDGNVTMGHAEIARMVALGVVDPKTRERIFLDSDVPKLARKNKAALMLLYTEITALSGSIEDEAKN